MLYCTIRVGQSQKRYQLTIGDLIQLCKLLPVHIVVTKLQIGWCQLTSMDAQRLLEGLRALDLHAIGDLSYVKLTETEQTSSIRELVEPFVQFLQTELDAAKE